MFVVEGLALLLAFFAFIAAGAVENSLRHWKASAQIIEPILARFLRNLPIQHLPRLWRRPKHSFSLPMTRASDNPALHGLADPQIVPLKPPLAREHLRRVTGIDSAVRRSQSR